MIKLRNKKVNTKTINISNNTIKYSENVDLQKAIAKGNPNIIEKKKLLKDITKKLRICKDKDRFQIKANFLRQHIRAWYAENISKKLQQKQQITSISKLQ